MIGEILKLSRKICVLDGGIVWSGEEQRGLKENERGLY